MKILTFKARELPSGLQSADRRQPGQTAGSYVRHRLIIRVLIIRVLRAPGQIDRNGTRKPARYRSAYYVYENIPPEIKAAADKREYQKRQNGGR